MININLEGHFSKNYTNQLGSPTWRNQSFIDAAGRVAGRGVLTNWQGGQEPCPENKYVDEWKKSIIGLGFPFRGWKWKDISTGCEEGKKAMISLTANQVRTLGSPYYTPCEDILAARDVATTEMENAQTNVGKNTLNRTAKRRYKTDVEKWASVESILNSYYAAGGENYLSCDKQIQEDAQAELRNLMLSLIEDRDQNTGISNTTLLVSLGIGIAGLAFVTLKFIK